MTDRPTSPAEPPDDGDGNCPARQLAERLAARLAAVHHDGLAVGHDERQPGTEERQPGHVVELAVGRRSDVAAALAARGIDVVATDVRTRDVPAGVAFRQDDLTAPDESIYAGATLLYARNLPAELQGPARDLAAAVDAPLRFTTLGAEEPVIPVERTPIDAGVAETLYRASDGPGTGRSA